MSRHKRWITSILGLGIIALIAACGSDATTSDPASTPISGGSSSDQVANDDEGITHDDPTGEAHVDDVHDEPDEEAHLEEESAADDHPHGEGMIDPDAPIMHVVGSEFGYSPASFDVEAGHAFTVMLHNEGVLEHDITIEGFEEMGGIHLIAGEDGMNTFMLDEPGEYTYYCTVPGHRGAGMTGTLIVAADDHDEEEDEHEEGDEHAEDEHEEDGTA